MYASSIEAESAFYDAFSGADVDAMMRLWAPSDDIVCIHPSGPRLDGLAAVRRSWELILDEGIVRTFDIRGLSVFGSDDVHIHMLEENISLPGTSFVAPPVLATNVYQRLRDGWYMVLHHASVAPSALTELSGTNSTDDGRRIH